jgi:hypothetical protein
LCSIGSTGGVHLPPSRRLPTRIENEKNYGVFTHHLLDTTRWGVNAKKVLTSYRTVYFFRGPSMATLQKTTGSILDRSQNYINHTGAGETGFNKWLTSIALLDCLREKILLEWFHFFAITATFWF